MGKNTTLSREEYNRIYHEDYRELKKLGVSFKFRTTKNGWYKLYFRNGERIGYRYCDTLYGKQTIIDTLRSEGYEDLINLLEGTVTYNAIRYIITGYSSADICQFQYEIILRKVNSFRPERKYSIITFMSRCLHNAIINEAKRYNTLGRCPRVEGDKTKVAKIYSINEDNVENIVRKALGENNMIGLQRALDLESILKNESDSDVKRIIMRVFKNNCSVREAAVLENIPTRSALMKIAKLKDNNEFKEFLMEIRGN